MSKEDYKTRIIKSPDGIIRSIFDGKLHSITEAAIQYPKEMKLKNEYYLYGIQYTKDDWQEVKREMIGVPPSKNPTFKNVL